MVGESDLLAKYSDQVLKVNVAVWSYGRDLFFSIHKIIILTPMGQATSTDSCIVTKNHPIPGVS